MRNFRIAPLEERHIKPILEIEKLSQSAPWAELSFRKEIGHPGGLFLVAEQTGEVVGYAACWIVVDEAHIINIAVHPNRRREGVGRQLICELLLRAQEIGATCSTLEVRVSNVAAIKMYEQLGYRSVGERKGYYPNNKEDALVMWLYDLDTWSGPPE